MRQFRPHPRHASTASPPLRHDGGLARRLAGNGTVDKKGSTLGQQGLDLTAHLRVSGGQQGFALPRRALARRVEQIFDLLETVGSHVNSATLYWCDCSIAGRCLLAVERAL